jgi:DNA-binding NtrC family response regulator
MLDECLGEGVSIVRSESYVAGDWNLIVRCERTSGSSAAPVRPGPLLCPVLEVICGEPQSEFQTFGDDFVRCPSTIFELQQRVRRLLPLASHADRPQCRLEGIVGASLPLLSLVEKLPAIAQSTATVLITGQTGSGKELFARAVHYLSPRAGMPFLPVNCAGLPDHLFENELFGHARGAYTDASTDQRGLIQVAEGGTLFLDEVETLSLTAQAKVLRFIQEREYRPLGSARTHTADVRVVAATNSELAGRIKTREFREDLYHRLNVLRIHVPTLRQRVEDIPELARHFAHRHGAQAQRRTFAFSQPALRKLMTYDWPGNVRELEGVVHRAVVLAQGDVIGPADIDLPSAESLPQNDVRAAKNTAAGEVERTYLVALMAEHHGNVSRAAKSAGRQRRVLQRLLQKYGLQRDTFMT